MKAYIHCSECSRDGEHLLFDFRLKNDCVYTITCPNGHQFQANILYHKFQKHFELAIESLVEENFRGAISSFAASYERFLELFIRIVNRVNNVNEAEFTKGWKLVNKQSERQLGAYIFLYLCEFGTAPPHLSEPLTKIRNDVVHQGHFPDKEQCMRYGAGVLDCIQQVIQKLYSDPKYHKELVRSINDEGDFSSGSIRMHYYAYSLIGTNRDPDLDFKSLEEMIGHLATMRKA